MKPVINCLLFATALVVIPTLTYAQVSISVNFAPPELPVYVQPPIPTAGYLWTPGYWAYSNDFGDYYWVPGTWVAAPFVGALWTPGYWGWNNGNFGWHGGYWGNQIGYYGGINYGFGYGGSGYEGGRWNNGAFSYNTRVNNVTNVTNVHITNVYSSPVNNVTATHVSFNGGSGGVQLQPTAAELAVAKQSHTGPTAVQLQHEQVARSTPDMRASANHGSPKVAAVSVAGKLSGAGAVAAKPGPVWNKETAAAQNQHPTPAQRSETQSHPQPQTQRTEPQRAEPQPKSEPQRAEPQRAEPQRAEPQQHATPPQRPEPKPEEKEPVAPSPQHAAPPPHPQPQPKPEPKPVKEPEENHDK